ncbi:hypothetical protein HGRIS_001114 [Hohenbuehelia grisea]
MAKRARESSVHSADLDETRPIVSEGVIIETLQALSLEANMDNVSDPNEDPFGWRLLSGWDPIPEDASVLPERHGFEPAEPDVTFLLSKDERTVIASDDFAHNPVINTHFVHSASSGTMTAAQIADDEFPRAGIRRHAAMGWAANADEVLMQPRSQDMPGRTQFQSLRPKMASLGSDMKRLINRILGEVCVGWPTDEPDIALASLSLVNGYVFYHERFQPAMAAWQKFAKNGGLKSDTWRSAKGLPFEALFDHLEYNGDDSKRLSQLRINREQVLSMFFDMLRLVKAKQNTQVYGGLSMIPDALEQAIAASKRERLESAAYFQLGKEAFEKAVFIPCLRVTDETLNDMKGKVIIESTEIMDMGVASGAFTPKDCYIIDDTWTRICRPGSSGKEFESLVFWCPDSPDDHQPTEAKIFGYALYGADVRTNITSHYGQQAVETEMKNIVHSVQFRENIKRAMQTVGTMVKSSIGTVSTNGVTHSIPAHVDVLSPNARPATRTTIQEQQSLRVEIERAAPVLQNRMYMFLCGFMPHLAEQQLEVARSCNLINRFGAPNYSSFASYGYSAAFHTDNDDTVTEGWVSGRSANIKPDESNFAWADFKLVVELEQNVHWCWDAKRHAHGTSMNRLCATRPNSWKSWAKNHPADGQWSRANVITHATASAAKAGR